MTRLQMNIIFSKNSTGCLFKNPEDEDKHGRLFDVERERNTTLILKAI